MLHVHCLSCFACVQQMLLVHGMKLNF
jgi:hypothetical protein